MKNLFSKFLNYLLISFFMAMCVVSLSYGGEAKSPISKEAVYRLPLELAMEAAMEAVKTCKSNGYNVTATIVDVEGFVKVQAKGDGSTIHTKDSSYGKAYTIVTMGPVFGLETTGDFAQMLNKAQANNPALAAIPNIPGILPLTGGVAIKASGRIIAGLGVGGAPGGKKDEVCALAGIKKISDRLPQ